MSRVTKNFGWAIPSPGTQPSYDAFRDLIVEIDQTVNSIEQAAHTAPITHVISWFPEAGLIKNTDYLDPSSPYWENTSWTVLSAGGAGAAVGSFTIRGDNRWAKFDLRGAVNNTGSNNVGGDYSWGETDWHFRAVINPGSLDIGGVNCRWVLPMIARGAGICFQEAASLAAGKYSITLEWRPCANADGGGTAVLIGPYRQDQGIRKTNWFHLIVHEIDPPYEDKG